MLLRVIFLLFLSCAIPVYAVESPARIFSFRDALQLAHGRDPAFIAAQANLTAAQARSDQALAGLLPQLSATGSTNANRRVYETKDVPDPAAIDHYNSNSAQISLTQPVWRRASQIAMTQADTAVEQAIHQVAAAEQDLLVRFTQTWFDIMLASDAVLFADQQVAAARQQWEQSRRAGQVELVAAPAVEEARARYDQAIAEQVAAETEKHAKFAALEQIIGPLPMTTLELPRLSDKYEPIVLQDDSLERWLALAESYNPSVLAALRGYDAAGDEARKQRAGHQPTLDVVASYGRNSQAVGGFPGQNGYDIWQGSVGLQLNVPLYAGGGQSAKVREALAMQEKAAQDLETARRNVRAMTKQAWFGLRASHARQTAALQAVKFSTLTLKLAEVGKAKEVKIELDVLQARQQLYSALRDLKKSRYDMITSYFKLHAAVGQLTATELVKLDGWFERTQ